MLVFFLNWLGEGCESHCWKLPAWVRVGSHFHLLLEAPEPNLDLGTRFLLGAFAHAWNRRWRRRGHVFERRYKSIPASGELAADGGRCAVRSGCGLYAPQPSSCQTSLRAEGCARGLSVEQSEELLF